MNGISCGVISVDIGPIFWWVLFTDHGYSLSLLGIVIMFPAQVEVPSCKLPPIDIFISTGFMVSAIHRGVTGMSRARASCGFQFLGVMDKATTLQSIVGVAL